MADLYLDHDVPLALAQRLRDRGHAATTARDCQLDAAMDEQHLLFARTHGRVLVGHNVDDYLLLHRAWLLWPVDLRLAWTPTHPGILLLEHKPVDELAGALHRFLSAGPVAPNTLHRWRAHDGWSRWLYTTHFEPIPR